MNFLERLAHKPLFEIAKRFDSVDDGLSGLPMFEVLRIRMLDVWINKAEPANLPEWLDSAATVRTHFEEILGVSLDDEGVTTVAPAESAAKGFSDVFETAPGLVPAQVLPPPGAFVPETTDIPFAIG